MSENIPKQEAQDKQRFNGNVRLAREQDLVFLKPILETWIRDRNTNQLIPEEIEEVLSSVMGSIKYTNNARYLVAEKTDGEAIGMLGLRPPEERMLSYASTESPIEMITAYVAKDQRGGKGVGKALVSKGEELARQRGNTEIIFNSGPRYRFSGWPIWMAMFGKPIAIAKGYYGEGGDAMVWRKLL
ncbi:MAG: GNAT family N-acetyltransferase [Candidatus Levybacteria bacterium]|nr:GNAT family N-acetyltransferase [Candidatus Levybacteria bacterium]